MKQVRRILVATDLSKTSAKAVTGAIEDRAHGTFARSDLIVVGTHGRRGFSKFFLGSVAERVIATAGCPVMTIRGAA